MTRSTETHVKDLEAQLNVQRSATTYYQKLLNRAYTNLRMMGRADIVKAIEAETLKEMHAGDAREAIINLSTPQPRTETEDELW